MALTVRLKTLDGQWETVGVDRLKGIAAEGIQLTSNEHGSDTARFVLKRDPAALYPDLLAFTPLEFVNNGTVVWSGRIWETPSKDGSERQITIEGRGWQYHLDDTPFKEAFVITSLSGLKDIRSLPNIDLNQAHAAAQVTVEAGAPSFGWGQGQDITANHGAGVYFDFGPDYELYSPYYSFWLYCNADDPSTDIYFRTFDVAPLGAMAGTSFEDLRTQINVTSIGRGNEYKASFEGATPRRYVSVFLWTAAIGTFGADQTVRINKMQITKKPKYSVFITDSNLRASDVIRDSIEDAAPLFKTPIEKIPTWNDEILGTPNVKGFYRFRGAGGNIPDESGNDKTLVLDAGAPIYQQPSSLVNLSGDEVDYAVDTNNGGYYSVNPLENVWTMEMIFTPMSLNFGNQMLFYYGNTGADGWGMFTTWDGSATRLYYLRGGLGTSTLVTLPAINVGSTYHLLATYDRRTSIAHVWFSKKNGTWTTDYRYIDIGGAINIPNGATAKLQLAAATGGGNLSDITIDEFVYYNQILEKHWGEGDQRQMLIPSYSDLAYQHQQAAFEKTESDFHRTSFRIPDFPMSAYQTSRETIEAVNAFHDYCWKATHDQSLHLYPKPANPKYSIGVWSGAEFEDASANSGEEIYNQVRIEGQDERGEALVVVRGGLEESDNVAFSNGDFATTTNWSITGSGTLSVGAAGIDGDYLKVVGSSLDATVEVTTSSFSGVFSPNRLYKIRGWLYQPSGGGSLYRTATSAWTRLFIINSSTSEQEFIDISSKALDKWMPFEIPFRFSDHSSLEFVAEVNGNQAGDWLYLDQMRVHEILDNSIPTRQGFIREKVLPINAAMTTAAAERIGDIWLAGRRGTPLKGNLKHTHPDGIRDFLTGSAIHPAEMLNQTCEKVHMSHRIDPDTGAWGRDGMISTVSYDETSGTATISVDNTRLNFEALLNRFAAIVGTIR